MSLTRNPMIWAAVCFATSGMLTFAAVYARPPARRSEPGDTDPRELDKPARGRWPSPVTGTAAYG